MVTWGLVARAENRGLGIIAWETQRNLQPDRTLLVEMGDLARGFPPHVDRYPGYTLAPFRDGQLPEQVCREWLAGLDVVLMLETAYDWRFVDWARQAGCATVLYTMPEFHRDDVPQADQVWNPTTWRHELLPPGARVVPMPVALDRFDAPAQRDPGPVRLLHNAGHRAAMDRNGTAVVYSVLRHLRGSISVRISGQDGRLPATRASQGIPVIQEVRGRANYWDVPAGADLLAMPRRYGGLCLPVQEAMAAGAVPLMPSCSPNLGWPIAPLPWRPQGEIRTPGGVLQLAHVDALDLVRAIQGLVDDPELLAQSRADVLAWARAHSWEALGPVWLDELGRVADGCAATT